MSDDKIKIVSINNRTDLQQTMVEESAQLADEEDKGKLVGYATVAIYEKGYDSMFKLPENVELEMYPLLISELFLTSYVEKMT